MANELATKNFTNAMNNPIIKAQIKRSCAENSGAFMSSMIDLYNGDKTLQNCDATRVVAECVKAAALGLPISKSLGFAYVVAYKNTPTFVIGYKGLIQLAQRSGQYQIINADNVYKGELKGFNKLTGGINLTGEREGNEIIGYFAYFKMKSGFEKTLYMTKDDIIDWAKSYSKSFASSYSPWQTEFDKMALKTVLSRLIRTYGIMSTELQQAMIEDSSDTLQAEINENANSTPIDVDVEVIEVDAPNEN